MDEWLDDMWVSDQRSVDSWNMDWSSVEQRSNRVSNSGWSLHN